MRQALLAGRDVELDLRQRRRGTALRQPACQALGKGFSLLAVDRADQRHHRALRAVVVAPESGNVIARDRLHALRRGRDAVGMVRVHRPGQRLVGNHPRLGVGLADGGDQALLLAPDHGVRVGRRLDQLRGQRHRLVQLGLRGQRAQPDAAAVAARGAAERRAGIGKGVGDLRLVAGRLAVLRARALVQQRRRQRRQPGLAGRVIAAAGIEIDIDVEHGDRRAVDKVHARAGGRGPVLDRDRGLGQLRGQQHGGAERRAGQRAQRAGPRVG
ncbi:hypothetical protein D9M72_382350 [compost metagenome]